MTKEHFSMQTRNYEQHTDPLELSQTVRSYESINEARKKMLNSLFSVVGAVFLFVFGFNALVAGFKILAIFLIINGLLSCFVLIYQQVTGDYEKAGYGVVYICITLLLYLYITGGVNNTGPLWCYVLSIIILFVLGGKKGGIVNGIFILYMVAAYFVDGSPLLVTTYAKEFEVRFVATFIATFIMAVIYERSLSMSQEAITDVGEQFYTISRVDHLTGLFNRRAMREFMEYEIRHAKRTLKPCSLLFVDADHFKAINDQYGHDCGDLVLKKMAEILKDNLRNQDTVSRWGGEEFVVLLPETPGENIKIVGEKLRKAIEDMRIFYRGVNISLTASLGGAVFDINKNIDHTINRADKNLYQAKAQGRNRVVV